MMFSSNPATLERDYALLKSAIDAHAIVAITDERGVIEYVNAKFCEISGYSQDELLGSTHALVNSGHHAPDFFRTMWQTIADGRVWKGEICNRSKAGALYWVDTVIVPMLDAAGRPERYVSIRTDITARREAERQLRESEEQRYRQLFERMRAIWESEPHCVSISDLEGLLLDINPAGLELLGVGDPASLLGRRLVEFVDPADRPAYASLHAKALAGDEGEARFRIHAADGTQRWIHRRSVPLRSEDGRITAVLSVSQDITSEHKAQAELTRVNAQLRALVQHQPDKVWLKDCTGTFLLSNPAHQRHWGLAERQIVGHTAHELFGPDEGARQAASDQAAIAAHAPLVYEVRLHSHAHGRERDFEIAKVAMRDAQGACIGLLGIARDVTEQKEAAAALVAAKETAEAGERAKAEFLANMSHEIRTPMNAVIGMGELLMTTPLSATQREFVEAICKSGNALMALINDILDFSKIEAGQLQLEHVPFDLLACVEGSVEIAAVAAHPKGLEVLADVGHGLPVRVMGDPTRLQQVLLNLLSNAVKFTAQGEVVLRVQRQVGADGRWLLHLSVRDTGIGIPADRLDTIFKAFAQVDASTTRRYGGTGLGLAICRRLVTLMNGCLWVESTPGQGTCFHLELPCEPAASELPAPAPATFSGKRVLLAESHALARDLLARQLRALGLEVEAVPDAVRARQCLAPGHPFQACLLDERLAADLASAGPLGVPVLLMRPGLTADPVRMAGVHAVVHKPLRRDALRAALSQVLHGAAAPAIAACAPTPPPGALGLRVLVAEDNAINQVVARQMLERLGCAVELVDNGQLAVQAVLSARAQDQPYAVVLMDVQMPVLDGLEATRRLRAAGGELPWIVALTANAMAGDREACLAAGTDDYLSKPLRFNDLAAALSRVPVPADAH